MVAWANNIALTRVRVRRWRVLIGLWRSTFVTESFVLRAIEIGFGWLLLPCAWLHDSPGSYRCRPAYERPRCHVCALTDAIVSRSVPSSGFQLRRILERARSANPRIDTARGRTVSASSPISNGRGWAVPIKAAQSGRGSRELATRKKPARDKAHPISKRDSAHVAGARASWHLAVPRASVGPLTNIWSSLCTIASNKFHDTAP